MNDTIDGAVASEPASAPVRRSTRLGEAIARLPSGKVVIVLVALVCLLAGPWWFLYRSDHSDERDVVYDRYIDALVDGDTELAWALGCRVDRAGVYLADFTEQLGIVTEAIGPISGANRLRGGVEWQGTDGSYKGKPQVEKVDGHYCVRLGGNPLGDSF